MTNHSHQYIFYQGRPVFLHMMADVMALDEHFLEVSDTPNHQGEAPGSYICCESTQPPPPNDRRRCQCGYNLVVHALEHLVGDVDTEVAAAQNTLHVVVLNIHLFHCHDLYPRILYPKNFLGLVLDLYLSHRHRHQRQHKADV